MSGTVPPERATQDRVIALFRDELGYRYLGDWTHREKNSNIEETLLSANLLRRGYSHLQIGAAIFELKSDAGNATRELYYNNQAVYGKLRYGIGVKTEAGKPNETVHLIDWKQPERNDFAIAEEVTLRGKHTRRPDLVLYVNGIAVAVIELKKSSTGIGEGIRQSISNQTKQFHEWFFSTVQFVFAGNDSEGLRYGTVGTPEKMFLQWKEEEEDNSRFRLDKYLAKMGGKARLLELMHDFVLFDGGYKKLPRVHQYFGIKAAQKHVLERRGGIIWHTQGSGKSIVMVLLAKWILENLPRARVAIVTDRDELDKQIERVFTESGEQMRRVGSGVELLRQLGQPTPRLLCSLVHKFGVPEGVSHANYVKNLQENPSRTVGDVYVFVDECHRTQQGTGKLHQVMKATMPDAVFIGFTGTPLLKKDKQTSLEVFGGYIHTYKFSEAVEDKVVLDLVYEARDIDQRLGSEEKIDQWFEAKTRGLNEWQKEELKKRWGTMQAVLSSRGRMERVAADVIFDFSTKPRLSDERGNAILVASSIYEATKYFTLFEKTVFHGKCAVVTSYDPQAGDIAREDTGANTQTEKQFLYETYQEILKTVEPQRGMSRTETYEEEAKRRFVKDPAAMKLLVVVDKLLTGFDAPPCTYLYLDKRMQDHGLFQAICRTNRLDGEDKEFGYIVDYKDLFVRVKDAISVYTKDELDRSAGGVEPDVLLKDRLKVGVERLETALEQVALLCEPVEPPRDLKAHLDYFCGNSEIAEDLQARQPLRITFYRAVAQLVRSYANLAEELEQAGYSKAEREGIQRRVKDALEVRDCVKQAADERLDMKAFEADMRHLIDTYIEADEPRKISPFDGMSLLELIVKTGIAAAVGELPAGIRSDPGAIAETIENNVRSTIVKEQLNDPAFYERMSKLLEEIIRARREKAVEYEEYLRRIAELARMLMAGKDSETPAEVDTPGKRALFGALGGDVEKALRLDKAIKQARPEGWRGEMGRENGVKRAMYEVLGNLEEVERVFLVVWQQREY